MCAREIDQANTSSPLSIMDDHSIRRAENGLNNLLDSESITEDIVAQVETTLRLLRDRLSTVQTKQQTIKKESEQWRHRVSKLEEQQRQVDQQLIDTRIKRGDILMEREGLACDVARAKRSLSNIEMKEQQESSSSVDTIMAEEESNEITQLQKEYIEEKTKLKLAEHQLVDVADEISRVKRKRTDLERKMKDAKEEW